MCSEVTVSADETAVKNELRNVASERWHRWRRSRETFPIAAWSYFDRFKGTKEEYETYAGANMTMVMPPPDQYENVQSTGLDIILGHFQPLHEDRALLERTVAFPSPDDSDVTAYMLKDEPFVEDYPALSETVEYIYRNDRRGAVPIIDFRPNWSVPYTRWNMTYETYLQRFIDEVHPCLLLNCHYPIMRDGGTRPVFYANIEWFRRKALENDIGLMGFVLVTRHNPPNRPEQDYREPSESDLRWMVYTYLAYGAKGIWYYNWRIDDSGHYSDALVDFKTGRPSRIYPMVAAVNSEILTIGNILLKLRSTGVYHTGSEVSVGTTRYAEGFVKAIHRWSGDNFIIGEFENQDDPTDSGVYIMIVNKRHEAGTASADLLAQASFSVYPDYPFVHCFTPTEENPYRLTRVNGRYSLELNGGQGVLLRFGTKETP